jgi:O-antigen/teichoic acid export membrane protein
MTRAEPTEVKVVKASASHDRAARALASFTSGSGFVLVATILGFWATPKIVGWIGLERFGLSRALIDLFAYLSLVEFGLAGASRPVLSREIATGDPERKAIGFAIVGKAYLRATFWKALIAVPLAAAAPFLIRIGHVSRNEIFLASTSLVLVTLLTPIAATQALLGSEQRDYVTNFGMGVQNIIITLAAVLLASRHLGVPGQTAAQLTGVLVMALGLTWITRRTLSAAVRARPSAKDDAHRLLRSLNMPTFLRTLVGRVSLMSDRVIVAIIVGGSAVTRFQSTLRLCDAISPHLLGVGNATWPGMADMHARGEIELFRARLLEVTTTICGLAILFASPVLIVNEAFVRLWMGPGVFGGWMLTLVGCGNLVLTAIVNYWDWCFNSTSNIKAIVPLTLVSGAVNIVVSVAATHWLGPVGPALGTLAAMGLVVAPWEARLLSEQFGVPLRKLTAAVARPLVLGVAYVLICRVATRSVVSNHWLVVAVTAMGTAVGWALVAWWTVFDPMTRRTWRGRVVRMLGHLRP